MAPDRGIERQPMKKLLLLPLAILALLLLPSSASAQLAANEVYVNTPFKIAANHDGVETTEYRLTRGEVLVATLPRTALAGGVIAFDQPGLAAGTYTFVVEAKGDGGQTPSAPFVVVVKVVPAAPVAPTGLRLVVQ
jgi:hypothetical protein